MLSNNQVSDKSKSNQKLDHMGNKSRLSKPSIRAVNTTMGNKDTTLSTITTSTSTVTVSSNRMNSSIKKNSGNNENLKSNEQLTKNTSLVTTNQSNSFNTVRGVNTTCVGSNISHESTSKSKDYSTKKFSNEIDT